MSTDFAFIKNINNKHKKEKDYHQKRRKRIWKEADKQYKPYSIMNIDLTREYKSLDKSVSEQV